MSGFWLGSCTTSTCLPPLDVLICVCFLFSGHLCYFTAILSGKQDFAHYKSGVYKHMTGDVLGGHAVKLIGWGTNEDGEDYWVG